MMLIEELTRVKQMMSDAASLNWSATLISADVLRQIEISKDGDLTQCASELEAGFKAWVQPHQVQETSTLFETYGEALTLLELKRRGVEKDFTVKRLNASIRAKKGLKTPDILCTGPDGDFYIEIKVLDMVGGQFASKTLMNDAFDNQVELDSRLKPGVNFGLPLQIAPHGKMDRSRCHAQVLDDYIRRIASNIKKDQLTVGPTFLLVVDLRVPLHCYDPTCLVPTYFKKSGFPPYGVEGECVSGDWWHVGLGKSGDLILGESEFEGKGNLQGRQSADGILVEFPYLLGLSVLTGKLSETDFRIHTLTQKDRSFLPEDEMYLDMEANNTAYLFSDAFNDSDNTRGWEYQSNS